MPKLIKVLIFLLVILGLIGIGGYLFFNSWYDSGINNTASESTEMVKFEVAPGEGSESIGGRLKEQGLIESEIIFKLYLRFEDKAQDIQAGDFLIAKNLTIPEIVDVLSKGLELDIVRVTVIEGFRLTQINDLLIKSFEGKEEKEYDANEFNTFTRAPDAVEFEAEVKAFLDQHKPAGKSLEGFLYPDTYEFENNATTKYVIESMIRQFIKKTENITKDDGFYRDLILASIIERESFTNDEKPIISSVFVKRLDIGMALQSDATVNYATGVDNPETTEAERAIDSPFNTYKYTGLPPTPINSPRLESIQAAINPADTDYFYFLHEQEGSGQVHFSNTFNEHLENKAKYLD